ncbi:MAG: DUF541 domain-containing protein [Clostridiales bacterium]|nr:DUF541 domain-containing protein [Clostridiales bacterium]
MKKLYLLMAILCLCIAAVGCGSQGAQAAPTLAVNAEGEATITPDMGYVTYVVETESSTAKGTQQLNRKKSDAIEGALLKLGIEEGDIATVDYSLWPDYTYSGSTRRLRAYVCRNTVTVAVKDLNLLGDVMDTAIADNSCRIQSTEFTVKDPAAASAEALKAAVKNARTEAEAMAAASGKVLGDVVMVSDSQIKDSSVVYDSYLEAEALLSDKNAGISTGDIRFCATVSVVYKLK